MVAEIRLLVAHDRDLVRETIVLTLRTLNLLRDSEIVVVGEAREGWETVEKALSLEPDAVLLHASMRYGNSSAGSVASEIKRRLPGCKILMMSGGTYGRDTQRAIRQGASGFMEVPFEYENLIQDLRQVMADGYVLSPGMKPDDLLPDRVPSKSDVAQWAVEWVRLQQARQWLIEQRRRQ